MMVSREFHLGIVLSITTGKMLSITRIGGIYAILNYMTADNLMTHQLPRASRECAPYLLRQHPQLTEVDASSVNPANWRNWLDEQVAKYGEFLSVEPMPQDDHDRLNPMEELMKMGKGPDDIIPIVI